MSDEWHRFSEVTIYVLPSHRLFRSSAPNYSDKAQDDATQDLTQSAVNFLTSKGITGIISFNKYSYSRSQIEMLTKAHIAYTHFPVIDHHAPSIEDLKAAALFYKGNTSTLVHCGYGWGRTGTGITALQLYTTGGNNPDENTWMSVNHVEEPEQMDVLREYRADLS